MNFPEIPADHDHSRPALDAPCLGCRCRAAMDVVNLMLDNPLFQLTCNEAGARLSAAANPDTWELFLIVAQMGRKPTRAPLVMVLRMVEDDEPVEYTHAEIIVLCAEMVRNYDDGPLPLGNGRGTIRRMRDEGLIPDEAAIDQMIRDWTGRH